MTEKKAEQTELQIEVDIWKSNHQQLVYGVVLEPNLEDSQGDIITAQEIEKAAHRYLRESRKHDVQHSEEEAPVEPVESYIAPHDMVLAGSLVRKGAWVLAAKVHDSEVWEDILQKRLTGFSIGGHGLRVKLDED